MDSTTSAENETLKAAPETTPETDADIDIDQATAAASRRWRSLWRIHFYSGMFALPFIVFMALTGLVILYTDPLQDLTEGSIRTVDRGAAVTSFDTQEQAVELAYPNDTVISLTVPKDSSHSTTFGVDDGSKAGMQVFVNPYTATVLGTHKPGSGLVGISNRLHGYLNNDTIKVSLPAISALWDDGAVMRSYVVGDLVLEVLGVWTLVLVMSGLAIWWPRRSRSAAGISAPRKPFRIRWAGGGRARWRDLHGLSGILLFGLMALTITSGLAWSSYWGSNFSSLADSITPNSWTDAPPSALGTRGALDRLGNQIHWNTGATPIPASYAPASDGSLPAPISLDSVVEIATLEGMKPGYTINFPTNAADKTTGDTVYGSFTLSNSWPRTTGEARDLFLDQFDGTTLAQQSSYGYGTVSYSMDTLVMTHMGTQLGLFSRVMMTALCVLAIWSAISAAVMFAKRRRPGTIGLPRRPVDVRLARRIAAIVCVMAIVYPVWGLTAAVILSIDRFLIRRTTRLRIAFGQR